MDYHDLTLLLELPALRLLRAQNKPMLLAFLHRTFEREHRVAVPEGQVRAALAAYLDELREVEPLACANDQIVRRFPRETAGLAGALALRGRRKPLILTLDQRDTLTVAGHRVPVLPAWEWLAI